MPEWVILLAANMVFGLLSIALGIALGSYVRNRILALLVVFLIVAVGFALPASFLGRYLLDRPVPTKAWLVFPVMGMFLGLVAAIGAHFAWKPLSPEQLPLTPEAEQQARARFELQTRPQSQDTATIRPGPAEITEGPAASDERDHTQDKGMDE
jgi:hypothetical protein